MSDIDRRLNEIAERKRSDPSFGLADSAMEGVTVSFLAQVFGMDHQKVKSRLRNCPIKERRKRGKTQQQHLYDLATAAEYLVEPNIDYEEVLKKIKREDLPPAINTAYWDAQLKRQKWEENAGQLWRTETIRSAIGGMFQTMKFTIQLWADTIERQTGLTEEQRELMNEMTDSLQQNLFQVLEENAASQMTGPQLAELGAMLEYAKLSREDQLAIEQEEEDEDDEDYSDLI